VKRKRNRLLTDPRKAPKVNSSRVSNENLLGNRTRKCTKKTKNRKSEEIITLKKRKGERERSTSLKAF